MRGEDRKRYDRLENRCRRQKPKIKGGSAMTPATSDAPDPPAASPTSDRGTAAAPPATARMATRMPNTIDRTAVPPARIRTVSEMAMAESSRTRQ